jgi:hypothetical protein
MAGMEQLDLGGGAGAVGGMVEIVVRQDHAYKRRAKRTDVVKGRPKTVQPPGCAHCGGAKHAGQHLGAPPSLNDGGSGMDRMEYQALKGAWQRAFAEALDRSDLPRGLASVTVEVMCEFPVRRDRDEGNHRWMIEKALGDALVGGYWERREPKDLRALLEELGEAGALDALAERFGAAVRLAPRSPGKVDVCVVRGGWLPSDSFHPVRRYSMGNLQAVVTPKESATRLMIFPGLADAE